MVLSEWSRSADVTGRDFLTPRDVAASGEFAKAYAAAVQESRKPAPRPFGTPRDRVMGVLGFASVVLAVIAPSALMFAAFLVACYGQSTYWQDRTREVAG